MKTSHRGTQWSVMVLALGLFVCGVVTCVAIAEDFSALVARLRQEKPAFAARHQALLAARYDLADRPAPGVTMSKRKPVQEGIRVKRPQDTTWEQLAAMSREEIKSRNLWPAGGMVFPQPLIDDTKRQTGRDLTRPRSSAPCRAAMVLGGWRT